MVGNAQAQRPASGPLPFLGNLSSKGIGGLAGDEFEVVREVGSPDVASDARTVDPVQIAEVRRRGRRKLTDAEKAERAAERARVAEKQAAISVEEPPEIEGSVVGQIGQGLFAVHQVLAIWLSSPEIVLSEAEADTLAKSVANVGRYYVRIKVANRLAAWGALVVTAGMIYAPRVFAIKARQALAATPQPVSRETGEAAGNRQ